MIQKKIHPPEIEWLESSLLKGLPHAMLTCKGNMSFAPFQNISKQDVYHNLEKLKKIFGFKKIILAKQIHSAHVERVDTQTGPFECDALITNEAGCALMILHADCQAAIFYDEKKNALGLVHAGWRGQLQKIYTRTIEAMTKEFLSDPKDIKVALSPSLGPENAEFIHYKTEIPENLWRFRINNNHFDLWSMAEQELLEGGILKEHISLSKINTFAHPQDFYSYRRDKGITGRNGTLAFLKK